MGRHYWDKRDVVEDCRSVSIAFLTKHDYFCGHRPGGITWKNSFGEEMASIGILVSTMNDDSYAKFFYTTTDRHSGEKTDYDYRVSLTTTPCNLGGIRYWFLCPLVLGGGICGRRAGTLYLPPGGTYFGCRHCYNLSYESRNESRLGRLGAMGQILKCDRKHEVLYKKIKRWTYDGKPTRKARRLRAFEAKLRSVSSIAQV